MINKILYSDFIKILGFRVVTLLCRHAFKLVVSDFNILDTERCTVTAFRSFVVLDILNSDSSFDTVERI